MVRRIFSSTYYVGGWQNPATYLFFGFVLVIYASVLSLVLDEVSSLIIAAVAAVVTEYYFFERLPQLQEENDMQEMEAEREAEVKSLIDATSDCISCMKPLGGATKCPHCGYDMSSILARSDR
jgi:hypothetical protein